jgi:DNA-binding transcriptional regulator YiaG
MSSNISADDIKAGRERLHMTQQQLADEVGVSLRTVGSWERGETIPRNRLGALAEALNLESGEREFGRSALIKRLGQLAKQRREEVGLGRVPFADAAGLGSDATVRDFEFGRHLPTGRTLRKFEKALGWRLGSIDEVITAKDRRAATITMADLDELPTESAVGRPLATYPTADLLREVITRLTGLEAGLRTNVDYSVLYGLAAQGHIPEHLEDEEEQGDDGQ